MAAPMNSSYRTSFDSIVVKWQERKNSNYQYNSPKWRQTAVRMRDQYNGDIVLPVLDEADIPMVVNIVKQGADTLAREATSTQPNAMFVPEKPGNKKSEQLASDQRQALYGFWDQNRIKLKDRRRMRHLIVYGVTPVTVRAVPSKGTYPIWDVRDPLCTYPCPSNDPEEMVPYDCIFEYRRSYSWIQKNYPTAALSSMFKGDRSGQIKPDQQYTILEYMDDYEIIIGVVGTDSAMYANTISGTTYGELDRVDNLAGRPLTVLPRRITLDRVLGHFDGILGMFYRQAEMMALTHKVLKQGIMPPMWVVGRPGEIPTIHSVPNPDAGEVGQISGGELVPMKADPSFMAPQMIDRLDEYMRQDVGTPSEFGGTTSNNAARTGVRGSQLMHAPVDLTIQELQETMELARQEENKIAIAVEKNTWGNRTKQIFVPSLGIKGRLTYTPKDLWTSDEHAVSYSMAGTDINNLAIAAGQRNAMGEMSIETMQELDPLIKDPEQERSRVASERIQKAITAGFEQQLMQGAIPISDGARVGQLVAEGSSEIEAILQVQKEAQQRQATAGPPGTPAGPAVPGSPEAQPGLAQPGQGAEAGIAAPNPDQMNLDSMLMNLRSAQRQNPAEKAS